MSTPSVTTVSSKTNRRSVCLPWPLPNQPRTARNIASPLPGGAQPIDSFAGPKEIADRVATVSAEVTCSDLHPRGRLAALVLGPEQFRFDIADQRRILARRGRDFVHRHLLVDQPFEDPVEHRIRRKAVLILLPGTKLG